MSLRISAKPVMCKRTLPPWPAVRSFAYGSFWQNLRPCRKKTSFAPRIFPGRTRRQPMADGPMDWQKPGKAGSAHGLHCHLHGFPKEDRQRPDIKNANKARSSLRYTDSGNLSLYSVFPWRQEAPGIFPALADFLFLQDPQHDRLSATGYRNRIFP